MAMTAGSASVDQTTGVITGTGMALALATHLQSYFQSQIQSSNAMIPSQFQQSAEQVLVGAGNSAIGIANAIAAGLVPYLVTNEKAIAPMNAFGSGVPAGQVLLSVE